MIELMFQKELILKETNASKQCKICYYWYFKDIGFKYEPHLFNGCHGLIQKAVSLILLLLFTLKECLQNSFLVYEQR